MGDLQKFDFYTPNLKKKLRGALEEQIWYLFALGFMFNQRLYFQIIVAEKDKIKEMYLNWYLPAINSCNVK